MRLAREVIRLVRLMANRRELVKLAMLAVVRSKITAAKLSRIYERPANSGELEA
jgi:hypothetical protein